MQNDVIGYHQSTDDRLDGVIGHGHDDKLCRIDGLLHCVVVDAAESLRQLSGMFGSPSG